MSRLTRNNLHNLMQTIALLVIMAGVCFMAVYMVLGPDGIVIACMVAGVVMLTTGSISSGRLLRTRGARPLPLSSFSELHRINALLARRAGLPRPPRLYWEPSCLMNGYATGEADNPAIVLSETLLRTMSTREITAILGHEMAHIVNNDLRVMSIAGVVQRLTSLSSTLFQIMLLLALPLIFAGRVDINLIPVMFIIFAPAISMLLQLALSRTREFAADQVGVQLTGDPLGLIQALDRLETYHRRLFFRFIPTIWRTEHSWLHTHPATKTRIERLAAMGYATRRESQVNTGHRGTLSSIPGRGLYFVN